MSATLKFGLGQWATKKGSTLAYNSENGNYKPLPFNFERASGATRVNKNGLIEVVSNNKPRIDFKDSADGSLLLEPSRTNYILKSDDVLSTYQSQNGDVSDASESINGFNNSIQIEYSTIGSLVYKRDFDPVIGTTYTISCFVQMNDNSTPIHSADSNSGDFCLINNNSFASASDIKTERLGSTNIYRVSSTRTATDTNNRFGIVKYPTQSSKGFKVTGMQLEAGSYATSYIPTQGSIGTRVAESCTQTPPSGIIGQTEGTIFVETSKWVESNNGRFFSISDGTTSNYIVIIQNTTFSNYAVYIVLGGVTQAIYTSTVTIADNSKIAVGYKANDVVIYVNGVQVHTDTSVTIPACNKVYVSSRENGTATFQSANGVRQALLYNTRLSNAQLQALTKI